MAVSLDDLRRLLDKAGFDHVDGPEGTLLFRVEAGDEPVNMVLDRPSEGHIVQFRTLNLLTAEPGPHRLTLLTALATANDKLKLVKFGLDPEDGEVCGYIDLVVGGGTLTEQQFVRCLQSLLHMVGRAATRFRTIISTGEDPGLVTEGSADAVQSAVNQLISRAPAGVANKGNGSGGHGGNGNGNGGGLSTKGLDGNKRKN